MYHPHHHHKIKKKVRRILQKKEELSPSRPKDCDDLQSNDDCSINSTIYGVDCSRNQENSLITLLQQKQNMICEPKKSAKMPIMPIFSKWSLFFRGRVDKSRINRTRTRSCTGPSLDQRWPNRNKSLNFIVLVFLSVFTSLGQVQGKPQPPPLPPAGFIDFDNLPVTRFSCEGKVIGGYYADVETGCQMFHVCTLGQKDEVQDIKFLCLNGTVFDQETRVCERVDEVDCSKAEQYYDLNLDLYVPHVATPKPPEPDLEQEDYIRPVSTHKPPPTTTTIRTTTTTRTTTPKATTTTPRPRMPSSQSSSNSKQNSDENSNKGFSSFNYYLKTPHSHVASGYNSESQQSYIFNHNPSSEEKDTSYTVSESTSGRKIPTGPKTIVYASSSARPRVPSTTTSTRAPVIIRPEEYEEQYADEYYDDEIPVDYDISSSTSSGSQQVGSNSKNYEVQQPSKNVYQQLQQYGRSKVPQNSYDYRDGRSTSDSKSDRGGRGPLSSSKGSETKSHVSVAFSSSKSTRSPPFILRTTPRPTPRPTTTTTARTTPRPLPKTTAEPEPYYYEDDYPDDTEIQEQERRPEPSVIVRMPNSISSTTLRTSSGKNLPPAGPSSKSNQQQISPTGPSSPSGPGDNAPEYYDDGEGDINPVNVNNHHFTHEDVPRIPFAKPNVPRVLVTNGKPFLPRLTRHIPHHNFSQDLLQHQKLRQKSPRPYRQSFWDTFLQEDYIRKKRNLQIHDEMKKV